MCASGVSEFYFFPAECDLLQDDGIAVDAIVKNRNSEVDSCDVPFLHDLAEFNADCLCLTRKAVVRCENLN